MKVRFTKDVAVDYEDCRLSEVANKSFRRHQTLEVTSVEDNGSFVNLHFENGDLAIDVPANSFLPV